MLTVELLTAQKDKLTKSKEAYEKQLAAAQQAVLTITKNLTQHEGALWQIDQLLAQMQEPAEVATEAK